LDESHKTFPAVINYFWVAFNAARFYPSVIFVVKERTCLSGAWSWVATNI
jgi:hypothetical protein